MMSVLLSQAGQGPLLPDMLHSQLQWINRNQVRAALVVLFDRNPWFNLSIAQGKSHPTPAPLHELYRLLSGDVRGFIVDQHKLLLEGRPSSKMLLPMDVMFDWRQILGLLLW